MCQYGFEWDISTCPFGVPHYESYPSPIDSFGVLWQRPLMYEIWVEEWFAISFHFDAPAIRSETGLFQSASYVTDSVRWFILSPEKEQYQHNFHLPLQHCQLNPLVGKISGPHWLLIAVGVLAAADGGNIKRQVTSSVALLVSIEAGLRRHKFASFLVSLSPMWSTHASTRSRSDLLIATTATLWTKWPFCEFWKQMLQSLPTCIHNFFLDNVDQVSYVHRHQSLIVLLLSVVFFVSGEWMLPLVMLLLQLLRVFWKPWSEFLVNEHQQQAFARAHRPLNASLLAL